MNFDLSFIYQTIYILSFYSLFTRRICSTLRIWQKREYLPLNTWRMNCPSSMRERNGWRTWTCSYWTIRCEKRLWDSWEDTPWRIRWPSTRRSVIYPTLQSQIQLESHKIYCFPSNANWSVRFYLTFYFLQIKALNTRVVWLFIHITWPRELLGAFDLTQTHIS